MGRNLMTAIMIRKARLAAIALLAVLCSLACGAEEALEALVGRVTPEYAGRVHFRLEEGLETPIIQSDAEEAGSLLIRAANRREGARAYGYYLRKIASVHLSWNGDNVSAAQFVTPEQPVEVPPTLPLNYAFNYTAMSYTGAHWDRERWLQEMDRLALNGFHYVLVTTGLEKVWQGFLAELGFAELSRGYLAHPCYAAWWHMGNLEGAGSPLEPELIESEAELGRSIVQRITELGMEPVLQGYVGFVPSEIRLEGDLLSQQGDWVAGYRRSDLLRPDSPEFQRVAQVWYRHLEAVYGYRAQAYAGDLFHEGGDARQLPLPQIAAGVEQAMQTAAPGSRWFLQAWAGNPRPELLSGLSAEHTIILALQKDLSPGVDITRDYKGMRYVWCELANFGGKQGLYGGVDVLEQMSGEAGGASGFGLFSEGLETNPLYYELFYERLNNRGVIDRVSFLKRYIHTRYGSDDYRLLLATQLLASTVYTPDAEREGGLENILCARPGLDVDKVSTWSDPTPYYDAKDVLLAGKLMLRAAQSDPELMQRDTFRYDLADICRQALAERARASLPRCKEAWEKGDLAAYRQERDKFCELLTQTSQVLATHKGFLLGEYLRGAEQRVPQGQAVQMTRSLRRLITRWSENPSSLNDYAHRQFAEMFSGYYLPRWRAFFESLEAGETPGNRRVEVNTNNGQKTLFRFVANRRVDDIEQTFPTAEISLLTEPQGDLLKLAERILR